MGALHALCGIPTRLLPLAGRPHPSCPLTQHATLAEELQVARDGLISEHAAREALLHRDVAELEAEVAQLRAGAAALADGNSPTGSPRVSCAL